MELRQLQYFVKVARKQHVTQAAEELHVAQSAVSRQIHQLEEQLGVNLFTQQGRNLQLTPVGKLFLSRVEVILTDLEKAIIEVKELLDPEVGEIRIAFPHSLGVSFIPLIVAGFRKEHPSVRFRFKQGQYKNLIKDVISGEVDLAFIAPFPEHHANVTGEVLLTEELFAVVPPGHVLSEYKSLRLEQLKNESFVLFSEGFSLRTIVIDACQKAGFTPDISFEGQETDTIRGLVAAGMGVSLLPEQAMKDVPKLQPVKIALSEPKVTRTIGLILRKNEKLPLVAEVFRRYLQDMFNCKHTER